MNTSGASKKPRYTKVARSVVLAAVEDNVSLRTALNLASSTACLAYLERMELLEGTTVYGYVDTMEGMQRVVLYVCKHAKISGKAYWVRG